MKLHLIENYFTPTTILDIGANNGQWYSIAKKQWPSSEIYSIEANKDCEPYLSKLNPNYKICLLAKDNNLYNYYKRLSQPDQATGNSIYKELTHFFQEGNYTIESTKGITLTDLFIDKTFDLIKLDTQGSELDIMSGGIEIIKKAKGILIEVSLTPYNENAPLYNDVIQFMSNLDFEPIDILDESHNHGSNQQDILFLNKNL
jgi:FkbM family methyltransferase